MNWNYRLCKKELGNIAQYTIHEVYYNNNGSVSDYSQGSASPIYRGDCNIPEKKIIEEFDTIFKEALSLPVLDLDEL